METIDSFHKNKMKYFHEIKHTIIPNLLKEKYSFKNNYIVEKNLENKLILLDKLHDIKNKIKHLKHLENDYLLKNMNYLEIYYNNIQNIQDNKNEKSNINNFFDNNTPFESNLKNTCINYWNANGKPNFKYYVENICTSCNIEMKQSDEGYVCNNCFFISHDIIDNSRDGHNDRITTTSYLRISYFKKTINQLNGRCTMKICNNIMEIIKKRIEIEKIEIINYTIIKQLLKKLKLKKYIDQIVHIMSILGINIIQMPDTLIDKLCTIFQSLQIPFQKYCPKIRSNFFPYHFIIYKLLLYLGESQYIKHVPFLKNIEKNQNQIDLFEK